ncbi:MAG: hypothetical protein RLZZ350_61 [Verrucomicrobiota bacterium]|jgi:hypothetical protein
MVSRQSSASLPRRRVPKEHLKIARRFNAGVLPHKHKSRRDG